MNAAAQPGRPGKSTRKATGDIRRAMSGAMRKAFAAQPSGFDRRQAARLMPAPLESVVQRYR